MFTKELPTKEILDELLLADFDTGKLYWKERDSKWFKTVRDCNAWNTRFSVKEAFTLLKTNGYLVSSIFNKSYMAHRIIYKMYHGVDPEYIDHISGVRTDNRIENLRSVTHQENNKNAKTSRNNSSGYQGVTLYKVTNKFRVNISINNKQIHLGYYNNLSDAVKIRKEAELKYGFHSNHGRVVKIESQNISQLSLRACWVS